MKRGGYPALLALSGLSLFLFVRPLVSGISYRYLNPLFLVFLLLLAVSLLLRGVLKGRVTLRFTSLEIPFALFILVLSASALRSVSPSLSRDFMVQIGTAILLFYLVLSFARDRRFLSVLLGFFLASAFLVSVHGIYQYFFGLEEVRAFVRESAPHLLEDTFYAVRLSIQRSFSTFVLPNALGGFLILCIPLAWGLLGWKDERAKGIFQYTLVLSVLGGLYYLCWCTSIEGKYLAVLIGLFLPCWLIGRKIFGERALRPLFVLIPLSLTLCLFLTGSLGAVLALFLALLIRFLFHMGRGWGRRGAAALLAALLMGVLVLFSTGAPVKKLRSSSSVRFEYWGAALGMALEKPLLGSGPGAFQTLYPRFRLSSAEDTRHAHNDYLQLLSETGIVGLAALLFLYVSAGRAIAFSRRDPAGALVGTGGGIGLLAFALHGLVDFDLFVPGITASAGALLAFSLSGARPARVVRLSPPSSRRGRYRLAALIGLPALFFCLVLLRAPLARLLYVKGRDLYRGGDREAGRRLIRRAANLDRLEPSYPYRLGGILDEEGNRAAAEGAYLDAIERSPLDAGPHCRLGLLLAVYGGPERGEEAERAFMRAEALAPHNPLYPVALARFYHGVGRRSEALLKYETALGKQEARVGVARTKRPWDLPTAREEAERLRRLVEMMRREVRGEGDASPVEGRPQ